MKVVKGPSALQPMEMEAKMDIVKTTELKTDGFKFEANPDFSFSFDQREFFPKFLFFF